MHLGGPSPQSLREGFTSGPRSLKGSSEERSSLPYRHVPLRAMTKRLAQEGMGVLSVCCCNSVDHKVGAQEIGVEGVHRRKLSSNSLRAFCLPGAQ